MGIYIVDNIETLQYALEHGMIDLSYVQAQVNMNKRKEILEKHQYKIWEGKDGKWYTYLPDEKKGRILKKRSSQKGIEDVVVEYLKEQLEDPTFG